MNPFCTRTDNTGLYHTRRSSTNFINLPIIRRRNNWVQNFTRQLVGNWSRHPSLNTVLTRDFGIDAGNVKWCSMAAKSCKGEAIVAAVELESCTASGHFPEKLQHSRTAGSSSRTWGPIKSPAVACNQQQRCQPRLLVALTFNVLADGLDVHGDFVKADANALPWHNRQHLVLEEIIASGAHVVCLQECNHFSGFFAPRLAALGYSGVFLPKCNSPANLFGCPSDGLAIFYRTDCLRAPSDAIGKAFTDANDEVASQCMLMQRLVCNESGHEIIVANFHLKAKVGAKKDIMRQIQAQQAVGAVAAEVGCGRPDQSYSSNGSRSEEPSADVAASPAVLLCGDMNAEPDSAACQAVRQHPLQLRSLWDAELDSMVQEAAVFTTWKHRSDGETRRVIDYMWSSSQLRPVRRWLTPPVEDIGEKALPNLQYGSDHIAVAAEFDWVT